MFKKMSLSYEMNIFPFKVVVLIMLTMQINLKELCGKRSNLIKQSKEEMI
jgi:hypothetical protein